MNYFKQKLEELKWLLQYHIDEILGVFIFICGTGFGYAVS